MALSRCGVTGDAWAYHAAPASKQSWAQVVTGLSSALCSMPGELGVASSPQYHDRNKLGYATLYEHVGLCVAHGAEQAWLTMRGMTAVPWHGFAR